MKSNDQIFRFLVDNTPIRGQLVSLDASWRKSVQQSDASDFARTLLGQALAAIALLAGHMNLTLIKISHKDMLRNSIRNHPKILQGIETPLILN